MGVGSLGDSISRHISILPTATAQTRGTVSKGTRKKMWKIPH